MATADGKTTIRFNTQPPEGGCGYWFAKLQGDVSFNTQPPEGGCFGDLRTESHYLVSTHSHPKVAALSRAKSPTAPICFNTQPPEGGCRRFMLQSSLSAVPTHSHPKVAAVFKHLFGNATGFQHTATRRWLLTTQEQQKQELMFQHTATRRWLPAPVDLAHLERCFNTQPPEGGCISALRCLARPSCFNTQPPEGGCLVYQHDCIYNPLFQHTATRRWLRRAPISAFSDG